MPARKRTKKKYPIKRANNVARIRDLESKLFYAERQATAIQQDRDRYVASSNVLQSVMAERTQAKQAEDRRFDALFHKLVDASRTTTASVSTAPNTTPRAQADPYALGYQPLNIR